MTSSPSPDDLPKLKLNSIFMKQKTIEPDKTFRQRTLLIERLDLWTLLPCLWFAWRRQGGYFVHASPILDRAWIQRLLEKVGGIRQLCYEDFPGSYFEVKSRAASGLNDRFFETATTGEIKSVLTFLNGIRKHAYMEVALRRVLLESYTIPRMKTMVMLRNLVHTDKELVFLPCDNRDPCTWTPSDLTRAWQRVHIPRIVPLINYLRIPVDSLMVLGYTVSRVMYLLFQHGLIVMCPPVRHWKVGFDICNTGIIWDRPQHDSFLYGSDVLASQNILHVVRSRLEDDRSRQHFERNRIPYVEVSRLPIPLEYFMRTILWRYLRGLFLLVLTQILHGRSALLSSAAAIIILPNLVRAEVLELTFQMNVFVARDEYSVAHILRTLLYEQRGGKTIGFIHGDTLVREPCVSYLSFHTLCLQGRFVQELLHDLARYSDKKAIIGAGIYGLDVTYQRMLHKQLPENYRAPRSHYKRIGVFASSYQKNFYLTRENTFRFYRAALSLLENEPDILLVLRPKCKDLELQDPEFHHLLRQAGSRVILEDKVPTYDLLPALDLVVCIAITTVGLESLMAGIPVIYYDEGELSPHPYGQYDKRLLARTPNELAERVGRFIHNNEYADPLVLDRIRRDHGFCFDGKVTERFRDIVRRTLLAAEPERGTTQEDSVLAKEAMV